MMQFIKSAKELQLEKSAWRILAVLLIDKKDETCMNAIKLVQSIIDEQKTCFRGGQYNFGINAVCVDFSQLAKSDADELSLSRAYPNLWYDPYLCDDPWPALKIYVNGELRGTCCCCNHNACMMNAFEHHIHGAAETLDEELARHNEAVYTKACDRLSSVNRCK
jgi:hypothetical protein